MNLQSLASTAYPCASSHRIGFYALIRRITATALGITLAVASTGCATMFGSESDMLEFHSEPEGATVTMDGEKLGVTPFTREMKHTTNRAVVIFKKSGYSTQDLVLTKTIAPTAFLNVVFITTTLGAPSVGTDAATGHLMKFSPRSYVLELEAVGTAPKGTSLRRLDSPLEYSVTNYEALRMELASGRGEVFTGLCGTYGLEAHRCDAYYQQLRAKRVLLDTQTDSLAWYRAAKPVSI